MNLIVTRLVREENPRLELARLVIPHPHQYRACDWSVNVILASDWLAVTLVHLSVRPDAVTRAVQIVQTWRRIKINFIFRFRIIEPFLKRGSLVARSTAESRVLSGSTRLARSMAPASTSVYLNERE